MKQGRSGFNLFVAIFFVVLGLGANLPSVYAQDNPNTISFDNKSGEPALVKLIGPTGQTVEVPNGQSRTVNTAAGEYYILTRYGRKPEGYKYAKGDPFTVVQTESEYSIITITLHPVIGGNYATYPISSEEFEKAHVTGESLPTPQIQPLPKIEPRPPLILQPIPKIELPQIPPQPMPKFQPLPRIEPLPPLFLQPKKIEPVPPVFLQPIPKIEVAPPVFLQPLPRIELPKPLPLPPAILLPPPKIQIPLPKIEIPPIVQATGDEVENLIADLKNIYPPIRMKAAIKLGITKDPRAVEPLITALKDWNPDVRKKAVLALGSIKDTKAIEPLIIALKDEDKEVRWRAAEALGEIKDPKAIEPLIIALKDEEFPVTLFAAEALRKIRASAAEPLFSELNDGNSGKGNPNFIISEIQPYGQTLSSARITLKATDNPNVFSVSGNTEFSIDPKTGKLEDNNWGSGAIHTLIGILQINGYKFESDQHDPLVFELSPSGYTYKHGKGRIITPKGGVTI